MGIEIYGSIFAGIGIFFIAFKSFTANVQELVGHRVREAIIKYTSTDFLSVIWGIIMGFTIQDTTILSCMLSSLTASGMLSMRKLVFIIAAVNIGSMVFLYFIFFDIKLIILYMVGLCGILFYFEKPVKLKLVLGTLFFFFLMQYAVQQINSQSDNIVHLEAMQTFSQLLGKSGYFITFIISAAIVLLTQSILPLLLITVNLYNTGIINFTNVMVILYGLHLGCSMRTYIVSIGLTGIGKRIIMLQVFFNAFIGIFFLLIMYIEYFLGTQIFETMILNSSSTLKNQVINLMVIVNIFAGVFLMIGEQGMTKILTMMYPYKKEDEFISLQFINHEYVYDTETAIDMLNKELVIFAKECLKHVEDRLEQKNLFEVNKAISKRHATFLKLNIEVDNFIQEVVNHHFSIYSAGAFFETTEHSQSISLLEDTVYLLTTLIPPANAGENTIMHYKRVLESIHIMISVFIDALSQNHPEDWELLAKMTSNDETTFSDLRNQFYKREANISEQEKNFIFTSIRLAQQINWTLHQIKHTS